MKLFLFILALLLPSFAFGQVQLCQPGKNCSSISFQSTRSGGAGVCLTGPNASWRWSSGLSTSQFGWSASGTRCSDPTGPTTALINMTVNETVVSSHAGGGWRAGSSGFQAADGSLSQTSFAWSSDPNTGFYRTAADTFAVVTGGARSFAFVPTAGRLEGTTSASYLSLTTSAQLISDAVLLSGSLSGVSLFGPQLNIATADAIVSFGGETAISSKLPTVSSGFGTAPSITGKAYAFRVNVGTGGVATSGVIAMGSTVSTSWNCTCTDLTTQSATVFMCKQTAATPSTVTIGNFNTAGAAAAWVASDIVAVSCLAF